MSAAAGLVELCLLRHAHAGDATRWADLLRQFPGPSLRIAAECGIEAPNAARRIVRLRELIDAAPSVVSRVTSPSSITISPEGVCSCIFLRSPRRLRYSSANRRVMSNCRRRSSAKTCQPSMRPVVMSYQARCSVDSTSSSNPPGASSERMLRSDVKYRFVIDMASLKG